MIKIGKNISSFSTYSCQPKERDELKEIINKRMDAYGPNCNLNDIDVSLITDMSFLFYNSRFTGDISRWNTTNVTCMRNMFTYSKFNGDISDWNVSNVKSMEIMFYRSIFNQDISNWDVSKVREMS